MSTVAFITGPLLTAPDKDIVLVAEALPAELVVVGVVEPPVAELSPLPLQEANVALINVIKMSLLKVFISFPLKKRCEYPTIAPSVDRGLGGVYPMNVGGVGRQTIKNKGLIYIFAAFLSGLHKLFGRKE